MVPKVPPGSDFLRFFNANIRLLANSPSHWGKWFKLIKFEAEYEHFSTGKVVNPQPTTSSPSFHNLYVTWKITQLDLSSIVAYLVCSNYSLQV